jgi:hypothetical protein
LRTTEGWCMSLAVDGRMSNSDLTLQVSIGFVF